MFVGDDMSKKEQDSKKIYKRKNIYILSLIGIILDQVIKIFIHYLFNNLSCVNCLSELVETGGKYHGFNVIPGKGIEIIKDFFYITEVKNTGGAWGMFSGDVYLLAIISAIVLIVLYYFLKSEKKLTKLSIVYYAMLFAGIIGNFIDRVVNGYVIDFLNFYIFGYDYPVFNIADIFIVLGIILMIIDVVRGEIHAYNERKRKCTN